MGIPMRSLIATSVAAEPSTLFGYDVIESLGEGAGSRIYAVSDPATRQLFALKHVLRKDDRDVRFIDQLETEYQVGRQVSHPCLRRCFDLKLERTFLRKVSEAALVMELFDGRSIEHDLPRSLPKILEVFIQTASALANLHDLGFVHCDLKPNNILINPHGHAKVIDLGQACPVGTIKERIQGTPDFIAPEQVKRQAVTERTDIFNFGATLYWAVCGQKLPTLYNLKRSENSFLLDDAIPTPRSIRSTIPENLSNLVMECVRTNPAKRPPNFTEVGRRLDVIHHSLTRRANLISATLREEGDDELN